MAARFLPAPDRFHHIEGVYPQLGVFRVYVTDNTRERGEPACGREKPI